MIHRPRRLRSSETIRSLVREHHVLTHQLIQPIFLVDGVDICTPLASLPGQYIWSLNRLYKEIEECIELGLKSFILFPKVRESLKDSMSSYATREDNFYLKAASALKKRFPDICLISDVALDPYNSDGHDGLVINGQIANDETLLVLSQMAVAQARAGFDILGPSDMMDGRVGAMREALDKEGYYNCAIMSYTAKYASAFYGPFRDALDSAPVLDASIPSDKKTYQMDPANSLEAIREATLDLQEGADFMMVKPALHYLDIIFRLKEISDVPIVAYHVSGECAMLMAATQNGWLDYHTAMPEVLLSIKRAGADIIISYFAKDYCKLQKKG